MANGRYTGSFFFFFFFPCPAPDESFSQGCARSQTRAGLFVASTTIGAEGFVPLHALPGGDGPHFECGPNAFKTSMGQV